MILARRERIGEALIKCDAARRVVHGMSRNFAIMLNIAAGNWVETFEQARLKSEGVKILRQNPILERADMRRLAIAALLAVYRMVGSEVPT